MSASAPYDLRLARERQDRLLRRFRRIELPQEGAPPPARWGVSLRLALTLEVRRGGRTSRRSTVGGGV